MIWSNNKIGQKVGTLIRQSRKSLRNLMYRVFRYTAMSHGQSAFKLKSVRNYGEVEIETNIPYKPDETKK